MVYNPPILYSPSEGVVLQTKAYAFDSEQLYAQSCRNEVHLIVPGGGGLNNGEKHVMSQMVKRDERFKAVKRIRFGTPRKGPDRHHTVAVLILADQKMDECQKKALAECFVETFLWDFRDFRATGAVDAAEPALSGLTATH